MAKSCGSGKIRRNSYKRRSYTRADGTKVKGSRVGSACVKDMGKPGKTRKASRVLPEFSGKMHLSNFGYAVDRSTEDRHKALREAARQFGSLEVLRHLNLARNYQSVKENKEIMSADVVYASKLHKKTKRSQERSSKKGSRKRSRKGSRKGSKKRSRKGSKK